MRLFLARIKDFIKMLVKFLTKDIWVLDFSQLSDARKRFFKSVKAFCSRPAASRTSASGVRPSR